MVRRLSFKVLNFALLASLVMSYSITYNKCNELEEYFETNEKQHYINGCNTDSDENIFALYVSSRNEAGKLKSKSIEKIFSNDIKYLTFQGVVMTQDIIDKISTLPYLNELKFYSSSLSASNFNFDGFKQLKNLRKITIYEDRINRSVVEMISNVYKIKELTLGGGLMINENDLELLSDLETLKILNILDVNEEHESIKNICKHINVEKVIINQVNVRDCSSNSDVSINECTEIKNFKNSSNISADFGECEINNEGKLIKIDIYETNKELQSKFIKKLFSYDTIKSLNFFRVKMNQKTIDKISSLSQLEKLTFYESRIAKSKLNFDGFKKLNKVNELYIVEDKDFTRDVFEMITKFSNLNSLSLEHTGSGYTWVKEEDYKLLENLKSLETIEIDGNNAHINYCVGSVEKLYFNGHYQSCYTSDDKCKQLKKYIEGTEHENENVIENCKTNDEGKIDSLTINANNDVDELNNRTTEVMRYYDSITSLTYVHDNFAIGRNEFPFDELTNLKELTIINSNHGHSSYEVGTEGRHCRRFGISETVIESLPKSIKKLNLQGIAMSQKNVDELATLTQLEDLTLYELDLNNLSLSFDGLSKLNKVTKLSVAEEDKINKKAFKVIAKFANVKELTLEGTLHPLYLEKEAIQLLKNLKSLKTLKLKYANDEVEAITNICSLTTIEKLYIDDKEVKTCSTSSTSPSPSSSPSPSPSSSSTPKISTNGKCGKEYGQCPSGKCCSKYGWCGTSDKYCGSGCQSEFGKCKNNNNNSSTTITKTSTVTRTTTTSKKAVPTSHDGRCGKKYGQCPSGQCCSQYGWCGKTSEYCGSGCQSEFGKCK